MLDYMNDMVLESDVWYEGYDEVESNFNYDIELGVDMVWNM